MGCCGSSKRVLDRDHPILVGDADGLLLRARTTIAMDGLRAGDMAWWTGTSVPGLVAGSILVPVP